MSLELLTAVGSTTLISTLANEQDLHSWILMWIGSMFSFLIIPNEIVRRYWATAFCLSTAFMSRNLMIMDQYDWTVKLFLLSQGYFKSYSVLYKEPNSSNVFMNLIELCGIVSTGMNFLKTH